MTSSSSIKGGGRAIMSSDAEEMIISLLYDSRQSKNPLLPKKNSSSGTASELSLLVEDNDNGNGNRDENGGDKDDRGNLENGDGNSNSNVDVDVDVDVDETKETKSKKKKKKKEKSTKDKSSSSDVHENQNENGNVNYNDLSDHEKKKERKKFLKKLVKCHNQQALAMKLNRQATSCTAANSIVEVGNSGVARGFNSSKSSSSSSNSNSVAQKLKSDKVRVDIVEAIFKDSSKSSGSSGNKKSSSNSSSNKSSSKSKKSSKENSGPSWKEGSTRKTMVLSRSTNIKDLMVQCKSKLKMKKPSRIFYVDKYSKEAIDLTNDLSGVDDGDVLFVTSYVPVHDDKDVKESGEVDVDVGEEETTTPMPIIDPLDSVKRAYIVQKMRRMRTNSRKPPVSINKRFPPFSNALDKLEALSDARSKLPAANYRSDILTSLDKSRVVVICGATGCGKSTQIPQYILEGMKAIGSETQTNILVTQPRRVAATSLAMRVSSERSSPPPGRDGSEVGYNVRLSKAISESTKITYCTVGILLRMLVNPMEDEETDENEFFETMESDSSRKRIPLSSVSHVIIDEVHERDLNTDFALTLLRPLLSVNKQISIILMSATASSELFVNYFRSSALNIEPKVFQIPGRTFPVETKWLADCQKVASTTIKGWDDDFLRKDTPDDGEANLSPRATAKIDNHFVVQLISKLSKKQWESDEVDQSGSERKEKGSGAILVFLPGKGEIQSLHSMLSKDPSLGNKKKCTILQLHSSLPPSDQWLVFKPVKYGVIKVILATNVAETSITIPDVSIVIDTGRVKESRFNSSTRIRELVTVWTSQASAKQRAGRAGRTGPGICYKLYTEKFLQKQMLSQTPPEIVRTPLEDLVLQVCLLKEHVHNKGTSPMKFLSSAPEPPVESRLREACDHLLHIGALSTVDENNIFRLTPLGYHLSHLPMDPKVGKILIVGCVLKCVEPALTIAAALSCSKSCWLPYVPGTNTSSTGEDLISNSNNNDTNKTNKARDLQEDLIRNGFGGESWPHGVVKGDLIAVVAAYNAWSSSSQKYKDRKNFAFSNALDHNALTEMKGLRSQFKDALKISGLYANEKSRNEERNNDMDALLTSCCLVSGLYPNIATLMRPSREKKIFVGKLVTKDGESCRASSNSFQVQRIKNASEGGKDRYAVYHCKHRTVGAINNTSSSGKNGHGMKLTFLSEVNFVSRFAILLFGGEIEVQKNYVLVDNWLKFKVLDDRDLGGGSDKKAVASQANAILIQELRRELDNVLLRRIINQQGDDVFCERVIQVVRKLLTEE